jgi:hypothetical protein
VSDKKLHAAHEAEQAARPFDERIAARKDGQHVLARMAWDATRTEDSPPSYHRREWVGTPGEVASSIARHGGTPVTASQHRRDVREIRKLLQAALDAGSPQIRVLAQELVEAEEEEELAELRRMAR